MVLIGIISIVGRVEYCRNDVGFHLDGAIDGEEAGRDADEIEGNDAEEARILAVSVRREAARTAESMVLLI